MSRDAIAQAEKDENRRLHLAPPKVVLPEMKKARGGRYTPLSRRQDRPNAILWLLRNHPELKDAQIMRLAGTTKTTLQAIRDRTHWNSASLQPLDPVTLGLCKQIDLDMEVARANKDRPRVAEDNGATLLPVEVTTDHRPEQPLTHENVFGSSKPVAREEEEAIDVDSVFASLKGLKTKE